MPADKKTRISPNDIRRRIETLHRTAGEMGDDFLQYLFGMVLQYLDAQSLNGQRRRQDAPTATDPRIAKAAKLLTGKTSGK